MAISRIAQIRLTLDHLGECELPLFLRRNVDGKALKTGPTAIVYGKNGAGKSSIARRLRDGSAQLLDKHGMVIDEEGLLDRIFVFDDDYVYANFRQVEGPSLTPVVLLGEAVEEQDELDRLAGEMAGLKARSEGLLGDASRVERELKEAEDRVKSVLRGSSDSRLESWARRSMQYNIDGQRKYVTPQVAQAARLRAESTMPDLPEHEKLVADFNRCIEELRLAERATVVPWSRSKIVLPFDALEIQRAMEAVSEAHATQILAENDIYARIRESGVTVTELQDRLTELFAEADVTCPHCFQRVDDGFKSVARSAISRYLADVSSDESISQLRDCLFRWRAEVALPAEIASMSHSFSEVREKVARLNELCDELNRRIQFKVESPQVAVSAIDLPIDQALIDLETALDTFEAKLKEHNELGSSVDRLRDRAAQLNDRIATHEVRPAVSQLAKAEGDLKEVTAKAADVRVEMTRVQHRMDDLNERRRSEVRAAVEINRLLDIVFGDGGLRLDPVDAGYRVMNRASDVPPHRLSTGERNILALCYFLVSSAQGEVFEKGFLSNQFLVLDDPISSFDYDNKFGVISLLSWLAWRCAERPSGVRLVVLTHDPAVAYELSKAFSQASEHHVDWRLVGKSLEKTDFESVDIYSACLKSMYEVGFTRASARDCALTANDVRRVWEAFVSFEMGGNIADAFSSRAVREHFAQQGEGAKFFLQSFPGRPLLHADSHSKNQVNNFNYLLLPNLDEEGFKRFVRGVVIIMHLISPLHVPSRVAGSGKRIASDKDVEAIRSKLNEAVATKRGVGSATAPSGVASPTDSRYR